MSAGERRARVRVLPDPEGGPAGRDGPVLSVQEAEVEIPAELAGELWRAEYLERLAGAYWRYLERVSLRLLRVFYEPEGRVVGLVTRRLPLLRFSRPVYETADDSAAVSWPIERGVLVAREGRGQGYLRIGVSRAPDRPDTPAAAASFRIRAEVANFYPLLRMRGRLSGLGARLYNATQMRIHVFVTRGFLRSLERLDLPPSRVGSLREEG